MADNRKLSALPVADTLSGIDLFYVVQGGLSKQMTGTTFITFAAANAQPAADNLTALAGLEGIAGAVPYFTGTGAMTTTDSTAYGRELLNLPDAEALRVAAEVDEPDLMVVGREYLGAWINALIAGNAKVNLDGDSTTLGAFGATPAVYRPSGILEGRFSEWAVQGVTVTNNGVGGSTSQDWLDGALAISMLNTPDLMILGFGLNDVRNDVDLLANYAAGLALIRETRPVEDLSIILRMPNTVLGAGKLLTPEWLESIRSPLRALARQYNCAFVDTYRLWQDAPAMTAVMIESPTPGQFIHPAAALYAMEWSHIAALIVPETLRGHSSIVPDSTVSELVSVDADLGANCIVSDAVGHPKPAFGDGTVWRYVSSNATVLPAGFLAILDELSSPPDRARKLLMYKLYSALADGNILSELDMFYVEAAHSVEASLVNWVNPGVYNLMVSGTPTFVIDRGHTGNGVDGALLTGAAQDVLTHYGQDSASVGIWCLNDTTPPTAAFDLGLTGAGGNCRLSAKSAGNTVIGRINDSTNTAYATATSQGLTVLDRTTSTSRTTYRDGASLGTEAVSSETLGSNAFQFMHDGGYIGYSNRTHAIGLIGGSLAGKHEALQSACAAWLAAVGAT